MANAALQSVTRVESVDTGIAKDKRKDVAATLQNALADTYILYLKTQGVHWNIVGPTFYSVHKLTEAQYKDMRAAVDALAERIRALGHSAPASFGDYNRLAIVDSSETPNEAESMIETLVADNEAVAKRLRGFVAKAEEADDVFTADMLTARIGQHEENAWMLRSILG